MTNTVVLFARILPTVASLPFEWLVKYFSLSFSRFNSLLWIVILAVLALAAILFASYSRSEAYAIHLLTLPLGASALLSWFSLDSVNSILSNFSWSASRRRLIMSLENLSDLLIHVYGGFFYLHADHIGLGWACTLWIIRSIGNWYARCKSQTL